jgi:glycosyltransferase involved in cell wall biosynthesis
VYAGAFAPHKGVHTAIEAMALLAEKPEMRGVTLSLVGSGHPDYEARLRRMVADASLQGRVSFWPRVPREEMPELLRRFDVLVFPSIWEENLARMMQEAMASGLVVVGTPTGGSPEALYDGRTGLAFPPGDATRLADCLEALARDPALRRRLVQSARSLVAEKFELGRMIAEIEAALAAVAGKEGACASSS